MAGAIAWIACPSCGRAVGVSLLREMLPAHVTASGQRCVKSRPPTVPPRRRPAALHAPLEPVMTLEQQLAQMRAWKAQEGDARARAASVQAMGYHLPEAKSEPEESWADLNARFQQKSGLVV